MPIIGKLTALKVAQAKRPGLYGDGGGLYLQVTGRGSKSFRHPIKVLPKISSQPGTCDC